MYYLDLLLCSHLVNHGVPLHLLPNGPVVNHYVPLHLLLYFLKVTPLIWASEGQNNESKSYKATQLIRWVGLMKFGK